MLAHLQGQVQVFLHHVHVEPGLLRHLEHERPAILHHGRGDDAVQQNFHGGLAWDAAFFGQQHALAERQHLHGQAQIGGDLHGNRQPIAPHMGDLWPDVLQDRFDVFESVAIPTDHDGEIALFQGDHASRYRRVEHLCPSGCDLGGQFPARSRAHGTHVHINLARPEPCQQPLGAARHGP